MASYFQPDSISPIQATNIDAAATLERSGSVGPVTIQPDLADAVAVTAAAGIWAYGAWATIVAANVLASHVCVGINWRSGSGVAIQCQVQIGTGAAGVEVGLAAIPFFLESNVGLKGTLLFPVPLTIPANARVAARCADGNGGGGVQVIKLLFMPRPIV